jgi:ABC-type Fe3+/spermidine/putrescine transport system ATPase subunit
MQSWTDCITGTHESSFWKRQRLEQLGTPAEIYRTPASRKIADFIGKMNCISGRLVSAGLFEADLGGDQRLRIAVNSTSPAGTAGDLLVRPEHIRFATEPTTPAAEELVGTVISQIYLGAATFYNLKIGETTLIAHHPGAPTASLDRVFISWPEREACFMPTSRPKFHG